jgi:hypothetical protein
VVRGEMRFRMGKAHRRRPGDVVLVPPGVPHDFANPGDKTALVRVDIRPALKMEQLFETAVALAQQGRTMLGGIPKPLDLAVFTRWLQRLALAPLAWLAVRRGHDLVRTSISDRRAQARQPPSKGAHRDDPFGDQSVLPPCSSPAAWDGQSLNQWGSSPLEPSLDELAAVALDVAPAHVRPFHAMGEKCSPQLTGSFLRLESSKLQEMPAQRPS